METARCPGCGAGVRPGAAWCSLCYLDLRPAPRPVTVPAAPGRAPRAAAIAAPLVEAALEPGPNIPRAIGGRREDVVDADYVEDQSFPPGAATLAGLRWPCCCGAEVLIANTSCPACGNEFLGDLRTGGSGRHRRSAHSGPRVRSRAARLTLAGLAAVMVAVLVPALLALLG